MSPLQTAVLIIAAVTIVGVVISFLRKSSALAGYDEIKAEVPRIASALKAEMFRDGDDVVLTGNYKGRPTQVRFSYAENTPGLNIRMQAPVSFTFSSVPKGARATEGRVMVRTGNDMFDAKFVSRTDHPTQAKMLIGSRVSQQQLEKLCCSQKTFLTMTRGSMELSELIIPAPYTGRHVLEHIESLSLLAKFVEGIPGAESVKIVPYAREASTPFFRIALIIGAIAALLGVFFIKPTSTQADLGAAGAEIPRAQGVDVIDAPKIGDLNGWHALRPEEYDPDVADVVRGAGFEPNGKVAADFDGDQQSDVAYALADGNGKYRVVLLRDSNLIYSTLYSNIVGIAPVPKSAIESLEWKVRPRSFGHGGVMVFSRINDRLEPMIMIQSESGVTSGAPKDWRGVSLR
jgi:hypothetical protein